MKMFRYFGLSFFMCVLASNLFCMKEKAEKNVSEWSKKFQENVQKEIDAFLKGVPSLTGNQKLEIITKEVNNVEMFSNNCEKLQNIISEGHKLLVNANSLKISKDDVGIYINHKEIKKFAETEKKIFVCQSTLSGQIQFGKRDVFLVNCTAEKDIMCLGNVVLVNTDVQGKIFVMGNVTIVDTSGKNLSIISGDVSSSNGFVEIIGTNTKNVSAFFDVYILHGIVDGTIRSKNKDVYVLVKSKTGKIRANGDIYLDYNSSCYNDKFMGAVSSSGTVHKIY